MKKFLTVLAFLLFPILVTSIAAGFGNAFVTLGAFVLSILILAFILRADIFAIVGRFNYPKDHQKGLAWMQKAMKTGKMKPKSRLLYAYLLLRNGELDDAESIINKTTYLGKELLSNADLKTAEFNLALITWKRGALSDAIMKLEELYSNGYLNSNLYGSLGYLYIANNEIEEAIKISKEGIEYNPDDMIAADNLGQAYIAAGKTDEAQEIYDELFERSPEFIEPYYNYATLLEKRGELAEAREYYETALTFDEKYLSTVTHAQVSQAIDRIDELMKN